MRRADIYGKDVVRSMVCKLGMIKKLRDEPLLLCLPMSIKLCRKFIMIGSVTITTKSRTDCATTWLV